jgi:lantibiotic transport system permease protein
MALTFVLNTKSEILKCRRTAAYWITLAGAALVPLLMAGSILARPDIFLSDYSGHAWQTHINHSWQSAAAFLLPMYVILVTSLVVQTEYKNNTWKQVYASPRSYADIFFSKFLVIQLLILVCFLLFDLLVVAGGFLTNVFYPQYGFTASALPLKSLLTMTGKLYVSILGVTAIQYWLSLRLKNYIIPLGIGLALLVTGLIIISWDKVIYFPYAYTVLTYFKNVNDRVSAGNQHEYYSLIWFAAIMMLSFADTVNRKERG